MMNINNKKQALERLSAIEKEAEELRKIIENPVIYDVTKLYVGIKGTMPFILTGDLGNYRFQSFSWPRVSIAGWMCTLSDPQECIDFHIKDGFEIHEFDNVRKGFEFFLEHYKG